MRQIAGCDAGDCPAIWEDQGTLVVQGVVEPGGGSGEQRVRIPRIVLIEAAKALAEDRSTEPMRALPERPEPALWANAATQPARVDWFLQAL